MGGAQSHQLIINDLRTVLGEIRQRLARLERENAEMTKVITNLKVATNDHARSIQILNEQGLKSRIINEGRSLSVRQPKGSKSMFVK